jgi:hypothetical protein
VPQTRGQLGAGSASAAGANAAGADEDAEHAIHSAEYEAIPEEKKTTG